MYEPYDKKPVKLIESPGWAPHNGQDLLDIFLGGLGWDQALSSYDNVRLGAREAYIFKVGLPGLSKTLLAQVELTPEIGLCS